MDSSELAEVCKLLKIPYVTSVGIINKFLDIVRYYIPLIIFKVFGAGPLPDYFVEYQ